MLMDYASSTVDLIEALELDTPLIFWERHLAASSSKPLLSITPLL